MAMAKAAVTMAPAKAAATTKNCQSGNAHRSAFIETQKMKSKVFIFFFIFSSPHLIISSPHLFIKKKCNFARWYFV
jgi:hypothetical protein